MSGSVHVKRMENYYGELSDIVRGGGDNTININDQWQFPISNNNYPINYYYSNYSDQDFGNPFTDHHLRDPLLPQESGLFSFQDDINSVHEEISGGFGINGKNINKINIIRDDEDEMVKINSSSSSIFSRMLHISPNNKAKLNLSAPSCDSPAVMQISSSSAASQNMGIKKRKNQVGKKVICIPAPAPVNSRPTGEIVPSDLWAWRKYGQKPIKGSPFPRGYYRCSSSKSCSARKQVERSRTDSNMLVITYTSEHNHPWPTQRNALAGSTRSTTTHHHHATTTKSTAPPNSDQSQKEKNPKEQEELQKDITTEVKSAVKKEEVEQLDNEFDMQDGEEYFDDEGLIPISYKRRTESVKSFEDMSLFADLGEINEADPFSLY